MTIRVRIAGVDYPPTLSTGDVATGFFDCSAEFLQRQRGQGTLPVEPLLLGNRLRWPTVEVARAIGLPFELVDDRSSESRAGADLDGARAPSADEATGRRSLGIA